MSKHSEPARAAVRAIDALRLRPEVRALRRAAARSGIPAWIVGGAVRDALLGLDVPEVDVAVERGAERLARELEARGAGRAVFLSRGRPGPTVFRVAGRRPIDIAELEGGSIERDLGRRDFTVNALAVSVGDGAIVDPFGGLEDLRLRRLTPVHARNLVEDPLRALRAARLYATHGLAPDRATRKASGPAAPGLSSVAAERIGSEISRLLGSPAASPALCWAARAGILGPALRLDLPPRRFASAARALASFDSPAVRRLPPERRRRLRLALLAGKLGLSAAQARRWLESLRMPRKETGEAARLLELVGAARRIGTSRDAWRWVLDAGELAFDALSVFARLAPSHSRRAASLRRLARAPRRRVKVSGGDLMRWLGIPPGPEVGALLSQLEVAAASGTVKSRREARHWLSGQVRTAASPAII
jgi:tRNA nucleotidyltransferase/poly(A) polymerase